LEWFWLREAERSARAESGVASARVLALIGRASLATEVAARTERPPEPFAQGGADAVAAELYREAIHWALAAHSELRATSADASEAGADAATSGAVASAAELLERVDGALLGRAAGGSEQLATLRKDLSASYVEFAELEPSAQRKVVERLERAQQVLLEPLGTLQRRLERIWVRRVVHVLGVLVLIGAVLFGAQQIARRQERSHDLAAHASWTTSSRYPQGGCESPRQECPGGESYFFHTAQESDPWVIFDLGKQRRVSTVEVDNRLDCCTERASPLVIDVSSDKKTWHEVARHTGDFATMRETFDSVRARYVKIHVPQPAAILHLSRVRIYP
jgi:N-acetylgalactosamine 4-sulfate 6-O-sulfotransferase